MDILSSLKMWKIVQMSDRSNYGTPGYFPWKLFMKEFSLQFLRYYRSLWRIWDALIPLLRWEDRVGIIDPISSRVNWLIEEAQKWKSFDSIFQIWLIFIPFQVSSKGLSSGLNATRGVCYVINDQYKAIKSRHWIGPPMNFGQILHFDKMR